MRREQGPTESQAGARPTGTITFVFTDIEGSTRRWDAHRDAMADAVRRHDALGRSAFESHGGYVFKTLGDAFCCAFANAGDAVAATLAFQRTLGADDFSDVGGLHVRAALHSGSADERDGDYFGPTLNRVARLLAIAHGGQTIVSEATHALAASSAASDVRYDDLGSHRLRDLALPERVYQIVASDLRAAFPPLRSLAFFPNNLPTETTSFVGRERETAEIAERLERARLVTLVGPGGIGKSRASLHVAANVLDRYPDGVWFVELAPLGDAASIATAIAAAAGFALSAGLDPIEALAATLCAKRALLLIDNCEHLVDACARVVATLLRVAPNVRILASSRQMLGIDGETTYHLPSLAVPPPDGSRTASDIEAYGAVTLFSERARTADARFVLDDATAPAVAEIVRRLDGIALAIELAASRVRVLDVAHIERRLDDRFRLLTGGKRDALPRQQTLRALIDWSYDLLEAPERSLFARLGVFVDGCSLESAHAVCAEDAQDEFDLLDLLTSLVDKSLVVADVTSDATRYRLLESTRAYALEKLGECGERDRVTTRHLNWIAALTRETFETYETTLRDDVVRALAIDLANVRAALAYARASRDVTCFASIAIDLAAVRAPFVPATETLGYLREALADERVEPHGEVRCRLLSLASTYLIRVGATRDACAVALEAVACARRGASSAALAAGLTAAIGALVHAGREHEVDELFGELERLGHPASSPRARATYHERRGLQYLFQGRYDESLAEFECVFAAYRDVGAPMTNGSMYVHIVAVEVASGRPDRAIDIASEALAVATFSPIERLMLMAERTIAFVEARRFDEARASAREHLTAARELDSGVDVAEAVETFGHIAAAERDDVRALTLLTFADLRMAALGYVRDAQATRRYRTQVARVVADLAPAVVEAAVAEATALAARGASDDAPLDRPDTSVSFR